MAALLSTRLSLRWGTDEPSEPTDTLVLNVGEYFMDLRVLKENGTIDWSMAGQRVILQESPLKCQWRKTLDSLGMLDPDEGTFTPIPDNPHGDLLECGEMPAPHKNDEMTKFEEVWRELNVNEGPRHAYILEKGVQGAGNGVMVGRAGGHFMALAKREEGVFSMRREIWKGDKWEVLYKEGDYERLPSFIGRGLDGFAEEATWTKGGVVTLDGEEFVVKGWTKLL